ncbi:MAG: HypC/HybG/HupF family hydrogenase formation chaperone [Pseudonocardiales bacterium]|nr:HypC/HybG/HupF family hydrogenase formation chaperone [Pseudonocardiales bacterium]
MSGREQPPNIDGTQSGTQSQCYGDTCITCSDEAVPVMLVELLADDLALADTGSGVEEVSVALVDAGVGDTVLVHAREAIAVLPRTAAAGSAVRGGGGR